MLEIVDAPFPHRRHHRHLPIPEPPLFEEKFELLSNCISVVFILPLYLLQLFRIVQSHHIWTRSTIREPDTLPPLAIGALVARVAVDVLHSPAAVGDKLL